MGKFERIVEGDIAANGVPHKVEPAQPQRAGKILHKLHMFRHAEFSSQGLAAAKAGQVGDIDGVMLCQRSCIAYPTASSPTSTMPHAQGAAAGGPLFVDFLPGPM